jgi:uncharacterized protein (UPF0276 family)
MSGIEREFESRVARIPRHGLGLSVDRYSPDLFEVQDALRDQGLAPGYLELFKADDSALAAVRERTPSARLAYHAEGLWITQPGWETLTGSADAVDTAARHAALLGCAWINHECAAKEMAGHAFGTYLPPLFTRAAAGATARNLRELQGRLDRSPAGAGGPLVLLEVPPLTYVSFGDLTVPEFFSLVTEQAACGVCLDIGHVWTVYRYTGAWRRRSLSSFLAGFLENFPLHRVVQVHVAGLEEAHAGPTVSVDQPPWWIDAHQAPIPEVLFEMLDQVLSHPGLRHLKGLALEVDTKAVPLIVGEYRAFQGRYGWWPGSREQAGLARETGTEVTLSDAADAELHSLESQYARYVGVLTGRLDAGSLSTAGLEPGALELYRTRYLPNEILRWGGDLEDLFPETCRELEGAGIDLAAFVGYWFREPRPAPAYDFFLLKLERFADFVAEVLPAAAGRTLRQAEELRAAYEEANRYYGASTVAREA